jgi:ABC-2 type transport system permease protein
MNGTMVWHLIGKELYFGRVFIGAILVAGVTLLLARALLAPTDSVVLRVVTLVLFFGVLNGLMWLPMATVTSERTEQTLAFLISLPITVKEYTAAKLIASVALFLLPWTILSVAAITFHLASDALPNAYLPLLAIVLTQLLTLFCLMLCVALISESAAVTSMIGIVANVVFWFSFAFIGVVPGMGLVQDPVEVWNSPVSWMLPAQLAAVPLLLAATYYFQSRKTDFI